VLAPASVRGVAQAFGVGASSLARHLQSHDVLAAAEAASEGEFVRDKLAESFDQLNALLNPAAANVTPHRALEFNSPQPALVSQARFGRVIRRDRLGGLIHEYRRAA
jgi:hypothetical protein